MATAVDDLFLVGYTVNQNSEFWRSSNVKLVFTAGEGS